MIEAPKKNKDKSTPKISLIAICRSIIADRNIIAIPAGEIEEEGICIYIHLFNNNMQITY